MKLSHITGMFVLFLLIDAVIIITAPIIIPEQTVARFPYREIIEGYGLPAWVNSLANFDGAQYLLIAQSGYQQFQQALFPLYPIMLAVVGGLIGGNHLLAGIAISVIAFYCSLVILNRYCIELNKKPDEIFWIMLFILAFPTSFYFHSVYTESIFFLLLATSLYAYTKRWYILAGVAGLFSSLTRLIGLFLSGVFATQYLYDSWKADKKTHKRSGPVAFGRDLLNGLKKHWDTTPRKQALIFSIIGPVLGLIMYMTYLWITYDKPLYFVEAQSAFDANRTPSQIVLLPQVIYRYIKILLTVDGYAFVQALLEFGMFSGVGLVLLLDAVKRWKNRNENGNGIYVSLLLFSVVTIILPTLTGTLSSTTRYALMCLSVYLFLGELKSPVLKGGIVLGMALLHGLMLGLFVQGYFVG